jgi:hypothetical protein
MKHGFYFGRRDAGMNFSAENHGENLHRTRVATRDRVVELQRAAARVEIILRQRTTTIMALVFFFLCSSLAADARHAPVANPGCEDATPKQCLARAFEAMGGRERLQQVMNLRVHSIGHTLLMEQSYRQAPFITSYEAATTTFAFNQQRAISETRLTWPESDENQAESTSTVVVGPEGGITRGQSGDTPCGLSSLDDARYWLALGPTRILLAAADAPDLRFADGEDLRSTQHTVLAFSWQTVPVKVLLNRYNHLPDAIDTTQQFHDFWFFWGDVKQRVYFDNWKLVQGIPFPTNWIIERNGSIWRSVQMLKIEFNVPIDQASFHMDAAVAARSAASTGWNHPSKGDKPVELAPGIDFFAGAWNSTIVKQADGIVILEAPISGRYTQGIIEEAKKRYPGLSIKAVVSTSDSWPHTGGLRFAVSQRIPVYILDLNRPLLDREMQARHSIEPDELEKLRNRPAPVWKIVSAKTEVGTGANRMELYPLRGASTERQYMVYFPEQHLLYASDTLSLNEDGTLYDPELMNEVADAVKRNGLTVEKVFAMHQGPTEWGRTVALVDKAKLGSPND